MGVHTSPTFPKMGSVSHTKTRNNLSLRRGKQAQLFSSCSLTKS